MRPTKKKARSEQLLDQLNPYHDAPDLLDDNDGAGAVVEDLMEAFPSSIPGVAGGVKKKALRRRAPLDSTLQQGTYAAIPRHEVSGSEADADKASRKKKRPRKGADMFEKYDELAADQAMDDIFGLLEGDDDGLDDEAADAGALQDEVAYTSFLEKKQESAATARKAFGEAVGASGSDENGILAQLSTLRNRQMNVVTQNPLDEGRSAGGVETSAREALRHSIVLFNALLRARVSLQGAIAGAIQMPQYYALPHFLKHSAAIVNERKVCTRVCRDVLDVLSELAHEYSTSPAESKRNGGMAFPPTLPVERLFSGISSLHSKLMHHVDETLEFWGSKVSTPNGAKLQAVNQPILDQIRAAVAAKTARMEQTSQKNRTHANIFGHPHHMEAAHDGASAAAVVKRQLTEQRALDIANGDIDPEIFDDGDFIRELVHKTGSSGIGGAAATEALLRTGDKQSNGAAAIGMSTKVGFHRLTKGKSVSYDPRPKLVGFMARQPYGTDDEQHATLLQSLFQ